MRNYYQSWRPTDNKTETLSQPAQILRLTTVEAMKGQDHTTDTEQWRRREKELHRCSSDWKQRSEHIRASSMPSESSVPTVAPQGLAILLTDAATQTETTEDEASPRLIRSKSLPPMYNLDWP
ncbi:hypothetical protein Tco_1548244 [Tanacetum coccineum]